MIFAEDWDVVILDLSIGGSGGIKVLKEIKRQGRKLPVLMLTMHSEGTYAIRVLRAGAAGYASKDTPGAELAAAIQKLRLAAGTSPLA